MSEDRHINFQLMRDRILAAQSETKTKRSLPIYPGEPGSSTNSQKKYWRSLEEFVDAPEFRELVEREFPQQAESWDDPVERRTFLKLMGASLALAGLSGCVYQPPEKIVPYIRQPEEEVPGKGLFFATAFTLGGVATPVLVRSNEGRPTKVEGNPDHPNYRKNGDDRHPYSATDIFAQASVLSLYDPDRSQTPQYRDEPRPWTTFVGEIRTALNGPDGNSGLHGKQGAGLRFLTETIVSPTLAKQLKDILTALPQARWHQYEPANNDSAFNGAMTAFGQPVNVIYDFSKAERILSIESDFLASHPGQLTYARDFAARRRLTNGQVTMNRLYVIESAPSITGANADHCWRVRPSQIDAYAGAINGKLTAAAAGSATASIEGAGPAIDAIVKDLKEHQGASIVIPGRQASPYVHALAHSMNAALGNVGKTVLYTDPVSPNPVDQTQSLRELVTDIDAGLVEMLVIVGGNPSYNTPADLKLDKDRLFKVALRVHHGQHKDETAELCHWHIPATHYLESWSDTRSFDGTASIVQPLIEPLYESKSEHELLAVFSDQYDRKTYDMIRDYWRTQQGSLQAGVPARPTATPGPSPATGGSERAPANTSGAGSPQPTSQPSPQANTGTGADFDTWWRKCLHDGFIPDSALPTKTFSAKAGGIPASSSSPAPGYEVVLQIDPSIHDGRFANNGWLQELPKPLSKVTWDNAAYVSPNTAAKLGVGSQPPIRGRESYVDTISLKVGDRAINGPLPVSIMPGQPDDVITLHLGYGRWRAGRVGTGDTGHGFNAYEIRSSTSPWFLQGAQPSKAEGQHVLATTQLHFNMYEDEKFRTDDRDVLRVTNLTEYVENKPEGKESYVPPEDETLYDPKLYDYKNQGDNALNYAWGMAIDLNNCVGCNACTIACQSENNIPVVGKTEVERSREMHWIRVDAYFNDHPSKVKGPYFQPVPCMHCENAPCEPVCPVHATVHSAEGLNDMVYNRCVGTKYCSNNCPYKVRRFNFFLYQDWDTPTYQLMRNPDVSVRSRGVMEKCTYCVQRIQSAKINAEIEDRHVRDGEIVTACQAVCPTEAIVFGDINDPNSRVSKLKAERRNYGLLTELNTRPRTSYLAAVRNPNPEIGE